MSLLPLFATTAFPSRGITATPCGDVPTETALDKAGVSMAVTPFGPFRFLGRLAPDGTEDATLLVGGENSAWTDQKGARMLAREGGVFLYLLPGPPKNPP